MASTRIGPDRPFAFVLSTHGLTEALKALYRGKKLMFFLWILLMLILLICSIVILVMLLTQYFLMQTTFQTEILYEPFLFPAVTICRKNPFKMSDIQKNSEAAALLVAATKIHKNTTGTDYTQDTHEAARKRRKRQLFGPQFFGPSPHTGTCYCNPSAPKLTKALAIMECGACDSVTSLLVLPHNMSLATQEMDWLAQYAPIDGDYWMRYDGLYNPIPGEVDFTEPYYTTTLNLSDISSSLWPGPIPVTSGSDTAITVKFVDDAALSMQPVSPLSNQHVMCKLAPGSTLCSQVAAIVFGPSPHTGRCYAIPSGQPSTTKSDANPLCEEFGDSPRLLVLPPVINQMIPEMDWISQQQTLQAFPDDEYWMGYYGIWKPIEEEVQFREEITVGLLHLNIIPGGLFDGPIPEHDSQFTAMYVDLWEGNSPVMYTDWPTKINRVMCMLPPESPLCNPTSTTTTTSPQAPTTSATTTPAPTTTTTTTPAPTITTTTTPAPTTTTTTTPAPTTTTTTTPARTTTTTTTPQPTPTTTTTPAPTTTTTTTPVLTTTTTTIPALTTTTTTTPAPTTTTTTTPAPTTTTTTTPAPTTTTTTTRAPTTTTTTTPAPTTTTTTTPAPTTTTTTPPAPTTTTTTRAPTTTTTTTPAPTTTTTTTPAPTTTTTTTPAPTTTTTTTRAPTTTTTTTPAPTTTTTTTPAPTTTTTTTPPAPTTTTTTPAPTTTTTTTPPPTTTTPASSLTPSIPTMVTTTPTQICEDNICSDEVSVEKAADQLYKVVGNESHSTESLKATLSELMQYAFVNVTDGGYSLSEVAMWCHFLGDTNCSRLLKHNEWDSQAGSCFSFNHFAKREFDGYALSGGTPYGQTLYYVCAVRWRADSTNHADIKCSTPALALTLYSIIGQNDTSPLSGDAALTIYIHEPDSAFVADSKSFQVTPGFEWTFYLETGCERSLQQDYTIATCGCADPSFPKPNDASYCATESQTCVEQATVSFVTKNRKCGRQCDSMVYSAEKVTRVVWPASTWKGTGCEDYGSSAPTSSETECGTRFRKTHAKLVFIVPSLQRVRHIETPAYPVVRLLSDIGAIIGAMFGVSVISIVELLSLPCFAAKYTKSGRVWKEKNVNSKTASKPPRKTTQSSQTDTKKKSSLGGNAKANTGFPKRRAMVGPWAFWYALPLPHQSHQGFMKFPEGCNTTRKQVCRDFGTDRYTPPP